MANDHSKAGERLFLTQKQYTEDKQRWASVLRRHCLDLDQHLFELSCAETFLHRALDNLIRHEEGVYDREDILHGAFLVSDALLDRYGFVRKRVERTKVWAEKQLG